MSQPSRAPFSDHLIVISRFCVPEAERATFLCAADRAMETLTEQAGCLAADLAQATDDPDLLLLRTEWAGIGAYRRALSSFDVKIHAVPLLSTGIDEPSAFESIRHWDGEEFITQASGLAADAGEVGLGHAAGPSVDPVTS
jgi:quinol monooxygenase YgiN